VAKSSSKLTKQQSARKLPVVPAKSSSIVTVPPGLVRCAVCHEFRGAVRNEDLPPSMQREEGVIAVLCICDGIPCSECGTGRIHRPISNYWDEVRATLIHCPWFSAHVACKTCRTRPGRRTA